MTNQLDHAIAEVACITQALADIEGSLDKLRKTRQRLQQELMAARDEVCRLKAAGREERAQQNEVQALEAALAAALV